MARKGLPRWAIKEAKRRGAKNIFAYAWTLVKRKGRKSRSRSKSSKTRTKRRRRTKTARRRKGRRRRSMTVPLAVVGGLAAGMYEPAVAAMSGNLPMVLDKIAFHYAGYNMSSNRFDLNGLQKGLVPLVIGMLVHKFVGGPPLNLNRTLGRAGVPFVRI